MNFQGDNGVLTYKFSVQDTVPPNGGNFFYINSATGEIRTLGTLRGDNIKEYRVSYDRWDRAVLHTSKFYKFYDTIYLNSLDCVKNACKSLENLFETKF